MALMANERFTRGTGPLISVLIPTRGRPVHLVQCIDSLYSLAGNKRSFEIILKVDDDDTPTIQTVNLLKEKFPDELNLTPLISPRGRGYRDVHLWFNQMAEVARGDWLFIFNDDARIAVERWDAIENGGVGGEVCGVADNIFMLLVHTTHRPGSWEFFLIRKEVYNVLGHLSLSPHVDTWLLTVMSMIQRVMQTAIMVKHGNDEQRDQTSIDRKMVTDQTIPILSSPWMIRQKINDAEKLLSFIEDNWMKCRVSGNWHSVEVKDLL